MKRMMIALLFALTATQVSAKVYDDIQSAMDATTNAATQINSYAGVSVAGPLALLVGFIAAQDGVNNIVEVLNPVSNKPMTHAQAAWKLVRGVVEVAVGLLAIPVGVTFTHNLLK